MRLLLALFSLSSPALAASDCVTLKPSGSEVCRSWDGSGLDITYRGSLISAGHAVFAKGTINGTAFNDRLWVSEPVGNAPMSAFANVWSKETGALEVQLTFVDDSGKTDGSYQLRLE